ncbi:MAG: hypothetical protein CMO81_01500 [Waddliaceae bacterium]|nr:hypothetical protein [Waddliaceae bacterium]
MIVSLPFTPFPLASSPHIQTFMGTVVLLHSAPSSKQTLVRMEDGDLLSCEVTTPENWEAGHATVLMVHGLGGSHESAYLLRMCHKLTARGYRVIRMNLRGCGSGRGHATRSYHSGLSDDLFSVIKAFKEGSPDSRFYVMGFSLGGNIVLKLAGELEYSASRWVERFIAICPPTDLWACTKRISRPSNRVYERYFVRSLLQQVQDNWKAYSELHKEGFPQCDTILEFDELYTCRLWGYHSAMDYYKQCSAIKFMPSIRSSCRILLSKDDPVVAPEPVCELDLPSYVEIFTTEYGGHMGFLGDPRQPEGLRWMDTTLLSWLPEVAV